MVAAPGGGWIERRESSSIGKINEYSKFINSSDGDYFWHDLHMPPLKSRQALRHRAVGYLIVGAVVSLLLYKLRVQVKSYDPDFGWSFQDAIINFVLIGCLTGLAGLVLLAVFRRVRASGRQHASHLPVPRHLRAALSFYLGGLAVLYGCYQISEWAHSLRGLGCGSGSQKALSFNGLIPFAAYFVGGIIASMTAHRTIRFVAILAAHLFPFVLEFGGGELNFVSALVLGGFLVLMSVIFVFPWGSIVGDLLRPERCERE